ncbi:hypothetical protein GJ744_010763 [Endocarpon pusillum]|uniref:Uncharacterized protein n=1 Tax=Endocarpon pusillum TaxID=364733 RepID=A0A8H7AFV9_9EURO|nr:hypothetical protein GJ744_010763 [Endocarpon pusillum]
MPAKHPGKYARLGNELLEEESDEAELQSLPYLKGKIKEGLRLSMANPSRLPRVVPSSGWMFKDTFMPSNTIVRSIMHAFGTSPKSGRVRGSIRIQTGEMGNPN